MISVPPRDGGNPMYMCVLGVSMWAFSPRSLRHFMTQGLLPPLMWRWDGLLLARV